ncbi:MAG: zinc-finger domain-containing protein [Alphaproteobacteria bacterium]
MSIEAIETEEVTKSSVACDGGNEHPRVWLTIPADGDSVTCPYCDKKFVLKK